MGFRKKLILIGLRIVIDAALEAATFMLFIGVLLAMLGPESNEVFVP